ncbi:hypothetical protein, partial [Klebsiella aerogenes]|uniref:hypothetical protein n=1 Tax=Klebsiella aerogenes TaxID=548 RepID=UPI001CC4BB9B
FGAAWEQCETGEFFEHMMERLSKQNYEDSKKQEARDKKQEEEEKTKRALEDKKKRKQEYLDRKQESSENALEYYTAKEELWLQVKQR